MRKSKFDQSPLPVQDSKYMNQDDNISEIISVPLKWDELNN